MLTRDMDLSNTEEVNSNKFVRVIHGITFIDAIALEYSVDKSTATKNRLRQKMIHAGVEFWNDAQTIVKKPVIGISAVGGFSISLEGDVPTGMVKLRMGEVTVGPMTPKALADGLRETMGMQSSHTYMNPNGKTARELYDVTVKHGHYSITHAGSLGMYVLGISKKAELEFDVQRDQLHLARETSARSACQDEPTLVAMTEEGARFSEMILKSLTTILSEFKINGNALDEREERNALYPLSASVSLGINATVRQFNKVMIQISDKGKECEFRNALALINDSLHGFLPEIFSSTASYQYQYPLAWMKNKSSSEFSGSVVSLFSANNKIKRAILLLGAPGVGKSTQTERIVKQMTGVMCVSTGNLVRKLNKKIEDKLPLNDVEKAAAESLDLMRQGKLMDDKAVYALLMAHLSPGGEGYREYLRSHTIILDGVIKASQNIKPFEEALEVFNKQVSTVPMLMNEVINISATFDELIERQEARVNKAILEGVAQRPDDNVDVYRQRLTVYMGHVHEVIQHYSNNNDYNLVDIDSSHGIEQTTSALISVISRKAGYVSEENSIRCLRK